jgi:hypothetical protein
MMRQFEDVYEQCSRAMRCDGLPAWQQCMKRCSALRRRRIRREWLRWHRQVECCVASSSPAAQDSRQSLPLRAFGQRSSSRAPRRRRWHRGLEMEEQRLHAQPRTSGTASTTDHAEIMTSCVLLVRLSSDWRENCCLAWLRCDGSSRLSLKRRRTEDQPHRDNVSVVLVSVELACAQQLVRCNCY